eukprot:4027583-Pyramimonas_sp.AAC.1
MPPRSMDLGGLTKLYLGLPMTLAVTLIARLVLHVCVIVFSAPRGGTNVQPHAEAQNTGEMGAGHATPDP